MPQGVPEERSPMIGVAIALLIVVTLVDTLYFLGKLEVNKRRLDRAEAEVDILRDGLAAEIENVSRVIAHGEIDRGADMRALVQRTDYLRDVMAATCKVDGWGARISLPDPPPGWPAIDLTRDAAGAWVAPRPNGPCS